jgi:hypothetical protein
MLVAPALKNSQLTCGDAGAQHVPEAVSGRYGRHAHSMECYSRDFGDMKVRDLGSDGLSDLICRQVFPARKAFSVYPRQARRVLRRQKHPSGRIALELNFLM